jgi:hypothetical protein
MGQSHVVPSNQDVWLVDVAHDDPDDPVVSKERLTERTHSSYTPFTNRFATTYGADAAQWLIGLANEPVPPRRDRDAWFQPAKTTYSYRSVAQKTTFVVLGHLWFGVFCPYNTIERVHPMLLMAIGTTESHLLALVGGNGVEVRGDLPSYAHFRSGLPPTRGKGCRLQTAWELMRNDVPVGLAQVLESSLRPRALDAFAVDETVRNGRRPLYYPNGHFVVGVTDDPRMYRTVLRVRSSANDGTYTGRVLPPNRVQIDPVMRQSLTSDERGPARATPTQTRRGLSAFTDPAGPHTVPSAMHHARGGKVHTPQRGGPVQNHNK